MTITGIQAGPRGDGARASTSSCTPHTALVYTGRAGGVGTGTQEKQEAQGQQEFPGEAEGAPRGSQGCPEAASGPGPPAPQKAPPFSSPPQPQAITLPQVTTQARQTRNPALRRPQARGGSEPRGGRWG